MEAGMKQIIPGIFALAALLSGCTEKIESQDPFSGGTHTVTFVAGAVETKTQVAEGESVASYLWSNGDADFLHIYENGVEALSVILELENGGATGTITAEFPDDPSASSFVYKGYYYKDISNSGNLKVPDTQSPLDSSYDPSADVLISRETEAYSEPPAGIRLTFGRVAVINKVTFKGMAPGEKVSKVTITGSEALAGTYTEATSTTGAKWHPLGKSLKFENFGVEEVDGDGYFSFYFVSIPFEGTINVSVTTDLNQYDKDIASTLQFEVGTMARLTINLEGCGEGVEDTGTYKLVNDGSEFIPCADYLIVSSIDGKHFAMGAQADNNRSAVEVNNPDNDIITLTTATKAYPIRIEHTSGGYFLIDGTTGQYLYNASEGTDNYLRSRENPSYYCLWSIDITDGVAVIENIGNADCKSLFFNSGSELFNDYASQGYNEPLALYVDMDSDSGDPLADPCLGFDTNVLDVNWQNWSPTAPDLSNEFGLDVFYYSSDEAVADVDREGNISFLGNGEARIMAFSKAERGFMTGYAECSVIFDGLPGGSAEDPFSVSDVARFIDGISRLPTTKEYYIAGKVSSVVDGFSTQYGNATFYISEDGEIESPQFEAYRVKYVGNRPWTQGDRPIKIGDEVVIRCKFKKFGEEYTSDKGCLVSHISNSFYCTARLSATEISYAGGSSITLFISSNSADWQAEIDNGAAFIIDGFVCEGINSSGDEEVTVFIPENEDGGTYTITVFSLDSEYYEQLVITQNPRSKTTVWDDDFSGIDWTGSSALRSLYGSKEGFTGNYSDLSRVYPISGKIKVGTASASGSLTTPALAGIAGDDAELVITLTAAGWNGKKAFLTLSASKGTVTPSESVQITSEGTMSGTNPSMTGETYTWTVTGADSTTRITISSNLAVGIDDLLIVQIE